MEHEGFLERFNAKVDKSGECWLFTGSVGNQYEHCRFYSGPGRSAKYAHRVAWELEHHKQIPLGGVIRHSCDIAKCVNPSHLLLGTQRDNVLDMLKRRRFRGGGRGAHGESNSQARLTDEDAIAIVACYATGRFGYRRLSRFFGVTPSAVKLIVEGRRWSTVTGAKKPA